jgi:hypothetical protein
VNSKNWFGTIITKTLEKVEPTRASGPKEEIKHKNNNGLELELSSTPMEQGIKVKLKMANSMDWEEWLTQMEISIKASGKTEWLMDLELFVILKAASMRVNGMKISSTEKVLNTGIIIRSNMRVILSKEKKLVKVNSNVKEVHTQEILLMVNSMEKGHIILLIQERFIRVVLFRINLMEKERWLGLIKANTSENLKMEWCKERVRENIKMEISIMASGLMINQMVLEKCSTQKLKQMLRAFGKTES